MNSAIQNPFLDSKNTLVSIGMCKRNAKLAQCICYISIVSIALYVYS